MNRKTISIKIDKKTNALIKDYTKKNGYQSRSELIDKILLFGLKNKEKIIKTRNENKSIICSSYSIDKKIDAELDKLGSKNGFIKCSIKEFFKQKGEHNNV